MNLPNFITLIRIFGIPVLIWLLSGSALSSQFGQKELTASALFIALMLTDTLDGYFARKRAQVTTLGTLLDPLADKLMITAAFVTLVQFNPHIVTAWMAVVIIGREFLVSGLRTIASSEGFTLEASDLGKFKTFAQIFCVVAAIVDHRWTVWDFGFMVVPVELIARYSIWFMVGLSLVSAADYFVAFWSKIDHAFVKRKRRRSFLLSRRRPKSDDVPVT